MKRIDIIKAIGIFSLVLLFGSCFSIPGPSYGPLGSMRNSAENRMNAEIASGIGLTGMTRKMMFNMMYAQVFYIGGFGANFYGLEETQGAIWRIESRDEDGTAHRADAERALLKKLSDGDQWWYLAWKEDGETIEFEALMNKDNQAKKIRYYNADVKRVEEAVFKETANKNSEEAPPPDAAASTISREDLASLSRGRETLRLNSGTYNTERLEWNYTDEDEKTTYTYTWWVDSNAAGGLVKYNWTKAGSKEGFSGELYSLKKGYTTKFSSF